MAKAARKKLWPMPSRINAIACSLLPKCIRTTRHAPNCQKHVSAVSNGYESTRSIYTFCTGEKDIRASWKQSGHSRNFELLGKLNAGEIGRASCRERV